MLVQKAKLLQLDTDRALVGVNEQLLTMVQSRLSLLEKAIAIALGSRRVSLIILTARVQHGWEALMSHNCGIWLLWMRGLAFDCVYLLGFFWVRRCAASTSLDQTVRAPTPAPERSGPYVRVRLGCALG